MARGVRCARPALVGLVGLLALVLSGGMAGAATLHVANNGEDSDGCGDPVSPCRSISRAIANASAGDTITVGPGRYGDLDGDGIFGEPGEETAPAECGCMIDVDKRVTLQSRDGAGVTVLDAGSADLNVVRIAASVVHFGGRGKGFTLTRGTIGLAAIGVLGLTVEGNLAVRNSRDGFWGYGLLLRDNLAVANGHNGFFVLKLGAQLSGNLAVANGIDGFAVPSSFVTLEGNRAVANHGHGVFLAGRRTTLRRNAVLGNRRFGIALLTDDAEVVENNVYGNNDQAFNGLTNCGLHMAVGGSLDATGNFWGRADGPGPDPADAVCNPGGADIDVDPVATRELPLRVTIPRVRVPQLPPVIDGAVAPGG